MRRWTPPKRWAAWGGSVLAVAGASLVAEAARRLLGIVNISLVYLIVVVAVATAWGLWPALFASLLAAAALDVLFVPPFGTLRVANPGDWLTLLFFLVIAALTGRLAAGARARAEEARRRERATALLYDLSTALIAESDLSVILSTIVQRMAATFGLDACHVLLPSGDGRLRAVAAFGPWPDVEGRAAQAIMRQVLQANRTAAVYEPARAQDENSARPRRTTHVARRRLDALWVVLYVPLSVAGTIVGIMRVARTGAGEPFGIEEEQLLSTFAYQTALCIDKANLAERARYAATLEETDRVKMALLSSVSHDLRSPLAAIKTAVTGLLEPGAGLDRRGRRDLLEAIDGETDRLTHFVADLLDLSRIQGGALRPHKEWADMVEIVTAVIDRLAPRLPTHPIDVHIPSDLPLLPVDYVRIDQVLSNLIENAAAYAPSGSPITITIRSERGGITVRVRDHGRGIAPAERDRVFEPFYRSMVTESLRAGSGLGLAICRGIVEAHAGWIAVEPVEGAGASIAFWLPYDAAATPDAATLKEAALA